MKLLQNKKASASHAIREDSNIVFKNFCARAQLSNFLCNKKIAYLVAVLCTFCWGLAIPLLRKGYEAMGIDSSGNVGTLMLYAGVRFIISAIIVYAVLCISEKKLTFPEKNSILPIISLGLAQTTFQYIFYYIGIGHTQGTNTALITSCSSFFTVLTAPLFFKSDKLTIPKISGCIVGFIGVLFVIGGFDFSSINIIGDGLILLSTMCSTSGNIISKKITGGRNPMLITSFQLLSGGLILVIIGLLLGGQLVFKNAESVIYLLILASCSAIAFSLWTALLKYHDASTISVFNLLIPVFGTILSGLILGENIFRLEIIISLILIIAGIILVNITFKRKSINI